VLIGNKLVTQMLTDTSKLTMHYIAGVLSFADQIVFFSVYLGLIYIITRAAKRLKILIALNLTIKNVNLS